MSAPTTDMTAWLDRLDEAHKATDRPALHIDPQDPYRVADGEGRGVGSIFGTADAALIVAAVNALPELVAVVRGVLALAEEWGGLPTPDQSHGDWGGYHDGHDSGLRSAAARLQDVVAAAHTEEGR